MGAIVTVKNKKTGVQMEITRRAYELAKSNYTLVSGEPLKTTPVKKTENDPVAEAVASEEPKQRKKPGPKPRILNGKL